MAGIATALFRCFAGIGRAADGGPAASVEDVIPITEANLRGHRMLYDEGWYLVSSTRRALDFAGKSSMESSREAIRRAAADAARRSSELGPTLKSDAAASIKTGSDVTAKGTRRSGEILKGTGELASEESDYGAEAFQSAANSFVRGHLSIVRRTEEDRRALAGLPGRWFKDLKGDFGDIYEKADAARRRFGDGVRPAWEKAFRRASDEFKAEYENSGHKQNSLLALGPILRGYLEALYHGLEVPAAKTLVGAADAGGRTVFLPAEAAVFVAGRTIESVGLTLFYTGKMGTFIISPTVEGGLLAGLSLASYASVPVTYAGGLAFGAVNQVAFTAAGPAAAAGEAAMRTTADAASYAGMVAYDAVSGGTRVMINQAESGVVLGYNALTALPTQALLGAVDSVFFLAWDGPRLAIAVAHGRVKFGAKQYSLGALPAGTIVDLKALRQTQGVKVEELPVGSGEIRKVLENLPADVRIPDAGH